MVKIFSIFLFEVSVYFIKFESSNLTMRRCQGFPGCCDFSLHISISNSFRLRDTAIFEIKNFLKNLIFESF